MVHGFFNDLKPKRLRVTVSGVKVQGLEYVSLLFTPGRSLTMTRNLKRASVADGYASGCSTSVAH